MSGGNGNKSAQARQRKDRRRLQGGRRATDRSLEIRQPETRDLVIGALRICDTEKKVFIHGEEKRLTPTEYRLLCVLAESTGRVWSTEELASRLVQNNRRPDPEDIKNYVYRLRKKLELDPRKPRCIRNVKGFGYLFVSDCD